MIFTLCTHLKNLLALNIFLSLWYKLVAKHMRTQASQLASILYLQCVGSNVALLISSHAVKTPLNFVYLSKKVCCSFFAVIHRENL